MKRYLPGNSLGIALLLLGLGVFSLLMSAGGTTVMPSQDPHSLAAFINSTPTIVPDQTPTIPYVPTYIVYARMVDATAEAIAHTLPTASPIPGIRPDRQVDAQRDDVAKRALASAVAMNPVPPDYDPRSEVTPPPPATPDTEPPPPHHDSGNGSIFDYATGDNPIASIIYPKNAWCGQLGERKACVYAGQMKEDLAQGTLILELGPHPGQESQPEIAPYNTPAQSGTIHIIDVTGDLMTLQADSGPRFVFNLTTRQWVLLTPGPSPSPGQSPLPSPSP